MNWLHRKTKSHDVPTTKQSEPSELTLLLIRPSISKIFGSPSETSLVSADAIATSSGMYNAQGINRYALERIPILCVTESTKVAYTIPMRLDLFLCLEKLASNLKPPVDIPIPFFENCDVVIVTGGLYTVRLFHKNPQDALRSMEDGTEEFVASKIVYSSCTTDEGFITNLRRLEATAKHVISSVSPETTTLPNLPPEVANVWQHDFLEPIFKRAKMTKHI